MLPGIILLDALLASPAYLSPGTKVLKPLSQSLHQDMLRAEERQAVSCKPSPRGTPPPSTTDARCPGNLLDSDSL